MAIKDIEPDRDDPTYCVKCDRNHSAHFRCDLPDQIVGNAGHAMGEKEMSVKELKLENETNKNNATYRSLEVRASGDNFLVRLYVRHDWTAAMQLDRNQAHLLMLYLQEHLQVNPNHGVRILEKMGYWLCGCGLYHPKDFVCERISK